MEWIDKEKRGENRTKMSKYEKLKVEEEEADKKRRAEHAPKDIPPPKNPDLPKTDTSGVKTTSKTSK